MFVGLFGFVCKPLLPQKRPKYSIKHPTQCSFPVLNKVSMGGSDDNGSGSSDDGSPQGGFSSPGIAFAREYQDEDDAEEEDEFSTSIDCSGIQLVATTPVRLQADEDPLHVPSSVWDCDMVQKGEVDGKKFWRCLHCHRMFKGPFNATKAKAHLAKIRGEDIKPCDKQHPQRYADMYRRQWEETKDKKVERKRRAQWEKQHGEAQSKAGVEDMIVHGTSRAAKRLRQAAATNQPQKSSSPKTPNTTTTSESIEHFLPGNIDKANLEMDYIVTEFIVKGGRAFNTAEDPLFQKLLQKARFIAPSYKPPTRKRITGELMNTLYQRNYDDMVALLLKESEKYGVAIYGDGATISKTPFFNILGSGMHINNACLEIHDCTGRMASGGRKDAKYIAEITGHHIDIISQRSKGHPVDLVIFDGASNVQKAGKLLEEKYPVISCIHGSEHVVSLFFSDIAKTPMGSLYV